MAGTVETLMNERGIEHHLTMPGSPQQNGKAEQFNHTVKEKAFSMLHTAGLSLGVLGVCGANHSTYLQ